VTAMMQALLEVRDLHVSFSRSGQLVRAVDGLSYRLAQGQALAIIGESGSGKTASSRALMGLLPPTAAVAGSVLFNGMQLVGLAERDMRRIRGQGISMIFQDAARALNPTMRVGHQITEAILQHQRRDKLSARARAIELLDLLRVPDPKRRFSAYPHDLSGGMRQRVMIAIAIACNPKLLIADEATRALDPITQAETLKLLRSLQQQLGMAVLMISHDLRMASAFADEVLVMYAGRAVEHASPHRLFAHPRMPYTRALLDAMPGLERQPHKLAPALAGESADLRLQNKGCPFEPRCASALAHCQTSRPALEEGEREHRWACWNPSVMQRRT